MPIQENPGSVPVVLHYNVGEIRQIALKPGKISNKNKLKFGTMTQKNPHAFGLGI